MRSGWLSRASDLATIGAFGFFIYDRIDPSSRFSWWPKMLDAIRGDTSFFFLLCVALILGVFRVRKMETTIAGWNNEKWKAELKDFILHQFRHLQGEMIAYAANRESRLRIDLRDYNGALLAALECYSAASVTNTNYIAHAFDAMSESLTRAALESVPISEREIHAAHKLVLNYPQLHTDDRAVKLKRLLDDRI